MYIHPIPYEMTLNEFFYKLVNREISPDISVDVSYFEQIKRIDLSKSTNPPMETTQTSPDCEIIELTSEFGKNIHYHLHSNEMRYSNLDKYKNGFDIIMQTSQSKQLYVPNFSHSPNSNCKQLLRLDIVKLIQNHQSGWSTQASANDEGKQFIISLSEALWYIDMCDNTKLKERSFNIPSMFHEFLGRANPEAYKGARKQFDINELNLHCRSLIPFLTSSWMQSSNFSWLYAAFDNFIVAISDYAKYLDKQRETVTLNHIKDGPIGEYCYSSRNNAYNVIFIWNDQNATESEIVQETMRITRELQNEAPLYHSRIMRANFMRTYEIPEHEYNYENDSVLGPSSSNQEQNIYNINDESDDNLQSDESSESVRSDESDQENENEINKIDDTCSNNPEEDTEDVISDPVQKIFKNVFVNDSWTCNSPVEKPYYSASIYPEVCYLCGSLDVNQPTPLNTTRPLRSKKNLPECESCAGSNDPTKCKGQRSFVKGKKVKSLHK
ncbi:24796_t:CDS:2 [Gigaspora rosea]|nr:24796_t:CDS:2 [Gigaspora rosea]